MARFPGLTQESGAYASRPGLEAVMLDVKLSRPSAQKRGLVSRELLVDRARDSGCRVVGVTAPAGYGKTTFLAEWLEADNRASAYVGLDRFDDDPLRLMALLAHAYNRVSPGNDEMVEDITGPGVAALGRAAPRLAASLRASSQPFTLMLDDLHVLRSPECHDVLSVVLAAIPDHSQVVTASRFEQPHIPRLRASGEVFELGVDELALDESGARHVFASQRIDLSPEEASLIIRRTEGWPVGISLAARIATETEGDLTAIAGDDRYVADYLYGQALAQLPEEVASFLRRTAVLNELSASLCDAVLQLPGSQKVLRDLEESHLFLVPLDRRREWYRYHELFREFLLGELRRVEPGSVMPLHTRAADWYEAHGAIEKGVEHLLRTEDRSRCAQLIADVALTSYQTGHMSTLSRWLSELGDDGVVAYPPLAVLAGEIALLTGRTEEAERWMSIVTELSYDEVPRDGTASFESSRAIFAAMLCHLGPEQMRDDAAFALEQELESSPWRDGALDMYAQALLLLGERERARELFEETSALAVSFSNTDNFVIAESELGLMALDRGDNAAAEQHVESALAAVRETRMHDYGTSFIAFATGARAALLSGSLEETHTLLAEGMRARQFCTTAMPYMAVRGRIHLAKVFLSLADLVSARHLLREITDILHKRPKLGTLVEETEQLRAVIASSTVNIPGRTPLTPAELRVLPLLQTHLTFPQIAERLFVSVNTIRTQVGSIYRKLAVTTRAEAVDQATRVGLLGG